MVFSPDSPPISPKTTRDGKRSQQASNHDLSLEELSSDNVGYDADIEVVRPDHIEEPDSESENDLAALSGLKRLLWPDTDDELASKMKELSWHRPKQLRQRERDIQGLYERKPGTPLLYNPSRVNTHGKRSEIDVEIVDGHEASSPAKRRKRRDDGAAIVHSLDVSDCMDTTNTDAVKRAQQASQSTKAEVTQDRQADSNKMDLD
ncbi:hypothetical protein DV736_g4047, partial [Chaetothyriales sp. CBS 134916]